MYDIELFAGIDGEPLARVTLGAAEVGQIAMWLAKAAENHTQNGMDQIAAESMVAPRWQEAQGESHRQAGAWQGLDTVMSGPFWAWVNDDIPAPWPMHPEHVVPGEDD